MGRDVFSKQIKEALDTARRSAKAHGHDTIEPVHLLRALLENPGSTAGSCFASLRVDFERARRNVAECIEALGAGNHQGDPGFSSETGGILERAMLRSIEALDRHVGTEHFLLAIVEADGTRTQALLASHGVDAANASAVLASLGAAQRQALG